MLAFETSRESHANSANGSFASAINFTRYLSDGLLIVSMLLVFVVGGARNASIPLAVAEINIEKQARSWVLTEIL